MPEWLSCGLRYIESWLAHQMRASEQPGCVIAVATGSEILLERAFRMADLASGTLLDPRHRFRVASHSKTFAAAAIMLLREHGRLRLDDPLGSHVPGLPAPLAAGEEHLSEATFLKRRLERTRGRECSSPPKS